jgi:ribA/ribD-fused uncharacterized protein
MTEEIRFYRAKGEYGFLSNLFKRPIVYEDREFTCSETAYQYGKPVKKEVADWLVSAPSPHLCAAAAHALFSFDISPDWNRCKVDRMRDILKEKFTQHKDLQKLLLDTGNARLIEESTMDAFWGVGKKGTGKNMLGILLMEVRDEIRWGTCEDLRSNDSGDALCAQHGECCYPNCYRNPDFDPGTGLIKE